MTTFMQKRFSRGSKPFRATLLGLLLAAFLAAPASSDASIAWLNKHRIANGIPPVVEVPLSEPCHDTAHDPEGNHYPYNWSGGSRWSDYESPWSGAPLHEFINYNPRYGAAGYGEAPGGSACMWIGNLLPQPEQPTFYQFVGAAGPSHVSNSSFVHSERPFAPQETVGIPQGVLDLGPQLLLYAMGFPNQDAGAEYYPLPVEASLTAADGTPVEILMATSKTVEAFGQAPGFLSNGAVMIVRHELPYSTTYHARVVWEGSGVQAVQEFSFTTRPDDSAIPEPRAKKRRAAKLRARFRVKGKNIIGQIRFAKGAKGTLRVIAACGKPKSSKRLKVVRRWASGAIVKGRVKGCAGKLRIKTRISAAGKFKSGQARVRKLRVG